MEAGKGPKTAAALFMRSRSVSAAENEGEKTEKNRKHRIRHTVDRLRTMGVSVMMVIAVLLEIMPEFQNGNSGCAVLRPGVKTGLKTTIAHNY
jgi:hypothetical protein